ncbi:unnamed protein product [Prunus armeniaca]|uniref:Uncharacterized protein n=1 Tax=Prunus armeniaca TaxID=36596 RepID=A0A6J5UEU7_PRUAR|nr:unnamed protein product [Prunus armeniaca]
MVRTGILTGRPKRIHVTIMEHVDFFGVCRTSESPICKCLKGSVPKSHEEWSKGNRTAGCVRKTKLFCESSTQVSQSLRAENELGFRRWVFGLVQRPYIQEFSSGGVDHFILLDSTERDEGNRTKLIVSLITAIGKVKVTTKFFKLTDTIEISRDSLQGYIRNVASNDHVW